MGSRGGTACRNQWRREARGPQRRRNEGSKCQRRGQLPLQSEAPAPGLLKAADVRQVQWRRRGGAVLADGLGGARQFAAPWVQGDGRAVPRHSGHEPLLFGDSDYLWSPASSQSGKRECESPTGGFLGLGPEVTRILLLT